MTRYRRIIPALALATAVGGIASGALAEEEFAWPSLLVVGTPGTGSASFASTNGWAPVLQAQSGMTVRVVPEDSEVQRHRRLVDRRDIALSSVSATEMAYQTQGRGSYAAMQPVAQRIVWHHNDTPWGFVVSGNSPLQSLSDILNGGVRVTEGLFSPSMVAVVREGLPAFLGIEPQNAGDVIDFVQASSFVENCRSVVQGRSDVAWCATISAVTFEMEGAPGGIRWLPLDMDDTEAWNRFLDFRPMSIPTEISLGVESARGIDGATSNFLFSVPADADEELVYNLARFFHDSFDDFVDTHPISARMSLEQFRAYLDHSPLPVHEGTIRLLRELGAWTEEDDAWNAEAIERMDAWIAARTAALEEARANRVRPDPDSAEFREILDRHTEGLAVLRSRL